MDVKNLIPIISLVIADLSCSLVDCSTPEQFPGPKMHENLNQNTNSRQWIRGDESELI